MRTRDTAAKQEDLSHYADITRTAANTGEHPRHKRPEAPKRPTGLARFDATTTLSRLTVRTCQSLMISVLEGLANSGSSNFNGIDDDVLGTVYTQNWRPHHHRTGRAGGVEQRRARIGVWMAIEAAHTARGFDPANGAECLPWPKSRLMMPSKLARRIAGGSGDRRAGVRVIRIDGRRDQDRGRQVIVSRGAHATNSQP